MSDRIKIHIDLTSQNTTAKMKCDVVGVSDYANAVLYDIQDIKPFPMFSKVSIFGKEEWFYCDYERKMLISKEIKPIGYWIEEPNKESEGKTMKHNATITKEENRVIEEYWVMLAMGEEREPKRGQWQSAIFLGDIIGKSGYVQDKKELDHNPTHQEIARFLSETKADFVSVEHNYRFEPELPFC